jgi:hypothetical protein
MLYFSHLMGECLARPLAQPPGAGMETPFWRSGGKVRKDPKRKMEAPQPYRSWGVYVLDRLCLGMILLAVTGMIFILAYR